MWDEVFGVQVFYVNSGQLQRGQGCQGESISLTFIPPLILHLRLSERKRAVSVVELEPDSQTPSPALSMLAAAISRQHLWWALLK